MPSRYLPARYRTTKMLGSRSRALRLRDSATRPDRVLSRHISANSRPGQLLLLFRGSLCSGIRISGTDRLRVGDLLLFNGLGRLLPCRSWLLRTVQRSNRTDALFNRISSTYTGIGWMLSGQSRILCSSTGNSIRNPLLRGNLPAQFWCRPLHRRRPRSSRIRPWQSRTISMRSGILRTRERHGRLSGRGPRVSRTRLNVEGPNSL